MRNCQPYIQIVEVIICTLILLIELKIHYAYTDIIYEINIYILQYIKYVYKENQIIFKKQMFYLNYNIIKYCRTIYYYY